jgi:hypothetical protein
MQFNRHRWRFGDRLVAASGNRELAGDRCEDNLDFISEPDQNRYSDDGNKSQDQGVFDEGLAFFILSLAEDSFMVHQIILSYSKLTSARRWMKIV